jgi:hypothetical protein
LIANAKAHLKAITEKHELAWDLVNGLKEVLEFVKHVWNDGDKDVAMVRISKSLYK